MKYYRASKHMLVRTDFFLCSKIFQKNKRASGRPLPWATVFGVLWLTFLLRVSSFTLEMFHIVWTLGYTLPRRDWLKSGLGKCWAAQLSFMKNGDTEERGTEIAGGLAHSKKSGTCWLSGVFLCLWPAEPLSITSDSVMSGLVLHTDPTPWAWDIKNRQEVHRSGGKRWNTPGVVKLVLHSFFFWNCK